MISFKKIYSQGKLKNGYYKILPPKKDIYYEEKNIWGNIYIEYHS